SEEQDIPRYIEKAGRTPKIIAALLLVVILCELVYYLFSAGGMEKIREAMAPAQGETPQSVVSQPASQSVSVPPITLPTPEPEPLPSPVPTSAYVFEDWDSIIAEKRLKYAPESVAFLPMEGATELYEFNDGIAMAKVGEKMGFIRDIAKGVEDARYDQIMPFSENKAAVCVDGKWGYVDSSLSADKSIACEWDSAAAFHEGYAVVSMNGREMLIDQWGTVFLDVGYEKLRTYSQGLIPARLNGKWGYIDIDGRVAIPFDYDDAGSFSSGLAVVVTGGKACYIDTRGNQVTGMYDDAWSFNENHTAKVKVGEKYGLISGDGGSLIQPEWDNIWNLQEGVATVQKNGKFGYVSQTDNIVVVQPVYSDVWSSTFGLIPVKTQTGKWGYVDRVGNTVIEPQYDDAYIFADGVARVGKGGKYCLIDLTGKELCDYSYKQMGYVREGYCPAVTTDGQWGYIKITYK
ncbi:MAG: WG repeat-containing protein, partial [Angelakisella sp.]